MHIKAALASFKSDREGAVKIVLEVDASEADKIAPLFFMHDKLLEVTINPEGAENI